MTTAGSNFISGISTFTETTDIVNKQYVDTKLSPSQAGNAGKFLITTDGTSISWDYVSNYQEFTTTESQTFTVPNHANILYIESVGAGGGGGAGQSNAQAGVTWTLRTGGVGANYNFTSFTNNLFFGFGGLNAFRSSTDGINWVPNSNYGFNTITFGNGTYVAGGLNGVFGSSTDAITWILRTSGIGGNSMMASIFDNNTYIFGGLNGQIITSTDAITWTLRTSTLGSGKEIREIIFQNNSFIACSDTVSGDSNLIVSTDTIIWTRRTSGFGTISINSITFGNNLYVAGGASGRLNTSTDTIHWTLRTAGFGANSIVGVKYGGNYIIVGGSGLIASSTNAIVWIVRTSNTTQTIRSLRYGNNTYITTGDSSFLATSYSQASGTGGGSGSYTSWYIPKSIVTSNITVNTGVGGVGGTTDATTGSAGAGTTVSWTGPGGTYTITASGGGAAGVAGTAQVASQSSFYYTTAGLSGALQSLDAGFTATTQTNQFQPTGGGSGAGSVSFAGGSGGAINVYGISTSASGGNIYGSNGSVGIAYTGLPYGSGGGGGGAGLGGEPDLNNWTLRTSGTTTASLKVTYGNNTYVVGGSSFLATSTNTISWTLRTVGSSNQCNAITFGNNIYVVAGSSGTLSTSTNAIIWTARTVPPSPFGNGPRGLIYLNNQYIAYGEPTGGRSYFVASTDSITWILRTATENINHPISDVTFGNGIYVLSIPLLYIRNSTDSIIWTYSNYPAPPATFDSVLALTFGNNTYVGGGQNGVILTSVDAINWEIRTSGIASDINSLIFTNNTYVAGGASGILLTSTDAISWTLRTSNTANAINTLTYGDSVYVASGVSGTLTTSSGIAISGSGGNGVRGGGGGGGATTGSSFGNGGNGGNGYVKITWW